MDFGSCSDGSYYIIYDYITEDGHTGSVMYVSSNGQKFEIDCSGTCSNVNETCRERYIFDPPSAECTCAGDDCKMTVNQL